MAEGGEIDLPLILEKRAEEKLEMDCTPESLGCTDEAPVCNDVTIDEDVNLQRFLQKAQRYRRPFDFF